MKKIFAVLLTLMMTLCLLGAAAADGAPSAPQSVEAYGSLAEFNPDDFAAMKTKRVGDVTTVTLSKEVESLQANWMGYQEEPEDLTVTDLTASVSHAGHKYQLGTQWTNAYWSPFAWEDAHDVYLNFSDTKEEIESKIASVRKYMNSGAFQKTDKGKAFLSWAVEVYPDVEVQLPRYGIFALKEKTTDAVTTYDVEELKVFDYGTKMADIEAAYDKLVKDNPDKKIYKADYDGYAWGKLVGKEYFGTSGAPDYAYITKQGDFKVVYGRSGKIRYFEKTVENVDLFGLGAGTATFTFTKNNAGWIVSKVKMTFDSGDYEYATAKYNGNGRLYGIGLKNAE